jgi:hypothetical protein
MDKRIRRTSLGSHAERACFGFQFLGHCLLFRSSLVRFKEPKMVKQHWLFGLKVNKVARSFILRHNNAWAYHDSLNQSFW